MHAIYLCVALREKLTFATPKVLILFMYLNMMGEQDRLRVILVAHVLGRAISWVALSCSHAQRDTPAHAPPSISVVMSIMMRH
jgi:hypothetical protein